jgi:plasmid stabilization system protein ParE
VRATFNALAERELNDAAAYYERAQAGLGAEFILEIERLVAQATELPQAGFTIGREVRRRLCPRFPYAILYRPTVDELRILAVMNLRRRPSYWYGRT